MEIEIYELPPIGTNAYLLWDKAREEAVLFDAPAQAWETIEPVLKQHNCKLSALYLTHGHFDHMFGAAAVAEHGAKVYAHKDDAEMLENVDRQMEMFMPGTKVPPVAVDKWLEAGQDIEILGRSVEVRHAPGHCPGSLVFYFKDEGFAIVGDVIFAGSVGRADLPGGSFPVLEKSIREQIYTLPNETRLLPGHGPDTTVGSEKQSNAFVRA